MKRLTAIIFIAGTILVSSCSFETYQCPAYSHQNKHTKHGHKAQAKYHKKNTKRNVILSLN